MPASITIISSPNFYRGHIFADFFHATKGMIRITPFSGGEIFFNNLNSYIGFLALNGTGSGILPESFFGVLISGTSGQLFFLEGKISVFGFYFFFPACKTMRSIAGRVDTYGAER